MVERICPTCQHGNPLDDRFCGKCGAALERQLPVRATDAQLTIAGRQLPVTWRQLGKTVAISAAALAAEAGLAWLRRRTLSPHLAPAQPVLPRLSSTTTTPNPVSPTPASHPIVTIVSQRIVEVWESDETRRIVERTFWRKIEG